MFLVSEPVQAQLEVNPRTIADDCGARRATSSRSSSWRARSTDLNLATVHSLHRWHQGFFCSFLVSVSIVCLVFLLFVCICLFLNSSVNEYSFQLS